tara:strand:+ start:425 stop:616 length:192 start_codon:yes stop_codon:yes gene_type:complete
MEYLKYNFSLYRLVFVEYSYKSNYGIKVYKKGQVLVFLSKIIVIFLSEMNPELQKRHLVALTA